LAARPAAVQWLAANVVENIRVRPAFGQPTPGVVTNISRARWMAVDLPEDGIDFRTFNLQEFLIAGQRRAFGWGRWRRSRFDLDEALPESLGYAIGAFPTEADFIRPWVGEDEGVVRIARGVDGGGLPGGVSHPAPTPDECRKATAGDRRDGPYS
jgi:hypothetical protein